MLALAGAWLAMPAPALAAAPPAVGQPAPALVMRTFAGARHDLADLRGRVVLVHYWASWCVPCREEMPRLDALAQAHAGELAILALSADDRHDRADAVKVAAAFSFPAGMRGEAERDGFGPPGGLPTTWVVDRDGRIAAVLRGSGGTDAAAPLRQSLAALGISAP